MKKILAALVLAVGLSGCASPGALFNLREATIEDLEAAGKIAQEGNDPAAAACFRAVKENLPAARVTEVAGPISAYAAARLRARRLRDGVPEEVHIACAPLIVDARKTALGLNLIP